MSEKKKHRRGRRKKNWFMQLSKGKKIAVCICAVFLCLILAGAIYLAAKLSKLNTDNLDSSDIVVNDDAQMEEGYTNVALFGIDSRSGELEKGTRTDCLIVASLNNETKEVKMISVYRDTVLDIENNYLQKCNAAYAFGGPTQAINMLNKNLDLDIQEYATVDFAAISNAIDMLGGLEIEIKPEEVKPLNKFVKETARVAGKKAQTISGPGLQLLDGVQATTYARIRSTAGGDFTRTERQRLVIEKIVEKAQKSDLATINNIIDELFPTIKTSFTATEILSYAKDFMKYKIADSAGFPFEKTTATVSGLGSIVIPVTLSDNVSQLHEFLYGTVGYQPSAAVNTINSAIIAKVGQREATDYSTLSSQTYEDTEEDKAQEHNEYAPPSETTPDIEPPTNNETDNNISEENTNGNGGGNNNGITAPPEEGNTGTDGGGSAGDSENTGDAGNSGGNTEDSGNSGDAGSSDEGNGNGNSSGDSSEDSGNAGEDPGNSEGDVNQSGD